MDKTGRYTGLVPDFTPREREPISESAPVLGSIALDVDETNEECLENKVIKVCNMLGDLEHDDPAAWAALLEAQQHRPKIDKQ